MTDRLPPNLLALFTPRPPLRYLVPSDHAPEVRHTSTITGVGAFLAQVKQFKDNDGYIPTESWIQRRDRIRAEKREKANNLITETVKEYKPAEEAKKRGFGDAFKTLFVSRLSYNTEQKDLEREFGRFGPIERIRIVTNTHADDNAPKKKKMRGYAFIVFERESDMKAAYKETDGIRIKDRRVLVDVERGRTVNGWRPRRFGGGLGGRGYSKTLPSRPSMPGAPPGPGSFRGYGGGFRGQGGRGSFRGGFNDRGSGGGYRGGFGGGRNQGFQSNGHGPGAPDGAPSGPRGPRREGGYGGGGRYDDRNGGRTDERARGSGSNREPVGSRHGGGGYRDRDKDRDRDRDRERDHQGGYGRDRDDHRKRPYEGDQYEDSRSKRRY